MDAMKRAILLAVAVLFISANAALAQGPGEMPKPGPEVQRLGYFVGKWQGDGELKPGPFGPGGKFTTSDNNEWFPGGFFLVMHSDEKSPMGDGKSMMVIGYNSDEKVYTFNSIDSMGEAETSKGTVQGDTWTWLSDSKMGGQTMKVRFTIKELSPTSYTTKFEMSMDGSKWTTVMEGKANKVK
jgi:hypothetical protein